MLSSELVAKLVVPQGPPKRNRYGEMETPTKSLRVEGVLVGPVSSTDELWPKPTHDKNVIRVDFPRGFSESVADADLEFDGVYVARKFKAIGDRQEYMEELTPGPWTSYAHFQEV